MRVRACRLRVGVGIVDALTRFEPPPSLAPGERFDTHFIPTTAPHLHSPFHSIPPIPLQSPKRSHGHRSVAPRLHSQLYSHSFGSLPHPWSSFPLQRVPLCHPSRLHQIDNHPILPTYPQRLDHQDGRTTKQSSWSAHSSGPSTIPS
jgi:hypothetical protein